MIYRVTVSLYFHPRIDSTPGESVPRSAAVLATPHGKAYGQGTTATHVRHVVRQEQAASRVLVQHSKEQVGVSVLVEEMGEILTRFFHISRVDELFRFLNSWVPQLYGELEEWKIKEMGYELIEHDTEWAQGGIQKVRIGDLPLLVIVDVNA